MPRKQITVEEQQKIITYVNQQFPNHSEKQIYSQLYGQNGTQFWEGLELALGIKASHARQFYMDSHTRGAYRESFRQCINQIDLKIIEYLRDNLDKFNELDHRTKPQFLRKFISNNLHVQDKNSEFPIHMEQVYDHVLGFFKVNGQFISTPEHLDVLKEKATNAINNFPRLNVQMVPQKVGDASQIIKKDAKQVKPMLQTQTDLSEASSYYSDYEDENAPKTPTVRVQSAPGPEEQLYNEATYHDMINQMSVPQVLNHIRIFSNVYKTLSSEGSRLQTKVNAYKGIVQQFIKQANAVIQ